MAERRWTVPLVIIAGLLPLQPAPTVAQRGLTARDLVTMERISDPQPSPDGEQVAFVRRKTDLEADRGRTDLWLQPTAGGPPSRLTTHKASDSSPRWDPSGEALYFLSGRSGSSQVWRIALDGGPARQVTDLPLGVSNLVVSPTGGRLAFTVDVFLDCADLECTARRLAELDEAPTTGRVYDSLMVRHWDRWRDGRRSHLFVMNVADGAVVDLTPGFDADVPSKPFGGAEEIAFSADGEEVVFTARDAGRGEAWSTDFDLFVVAADGTGAPGNLTPDNPAWDTHPVFSPDGATLAYLAMERAGFESDRFRIVLRDWRSGEERVLTREWDRSVGNFVFSPGGDRIYATAQDTGEVPLFAIEVESGAVETLVTGGHVRSPAPIGDELVFGMDSLTAPVDLYRFDPETGRRRRLTSVNNARLKKIDMGEAEQFSFPGWNDERVHAWVVKPAGFESDVSYPVAFIIHGGPQGSSDNDFHYRWNPQVYAGAGYAVVMVDFHGSTGYGQPFTDSITGDWGGKPLADLRAGLAAALERYPWMDGERVCALGASYGGYMVNWIAGNWPERFRCLVNHDGIFDNRMMYFATEELWFPEWEHGGPYWTSPDSFERHNPAAFVDRWRTPMLVIHGALDFRVPETQSLATFTALQRQGVASRLLYFPDENHWVLKPNNSLQWHAEVLDWLDRWLSD